MEKDFEENNYSIISNEELQDMTDSTSLLDSSSLISHNSIYQSNHNHYSNYNQPRMPPPSRDLGGMYGAHGSSSGNGVSMEEFRQYMDTLTMYLYRNDPMSLKYLEDNINRCKNGDMELLDTGRETPLLFPAMHTLVKLDFPGLLYQLIPSVLSQTGGKINITDEIYSKDFDFLNDDYPGPLSLEKTTEEQIFDYLKDQMKVEHQDSSPVDWDSGNLLINYLELLIKENGKPKISDVVRLLNEGVEAQTANLRKEYKSHNSISRNSFSRASSRAASIMSSRAASPEREDTVYPDLPQNSLDNPRGPSSVTSVMHRAVNNISNDQILCQNMDKFRKYIFSGRFEEAVNFSTRAGLWDHAFALALRLNNQTLINEILVKFSRRAINDNDPIFTMHELMSNRMPKIVATNRGFSPKSECEIGEWRSHLSMILAVKKYRPEESPQAIESMGEKLFLLRSYFAAHLCFLLAGTAFGVDKSAHKYRRKFDLLGWPSSTSNIPIQKSTYANCHKLFSGLDYWNSAPGQYIKLTEIYEYVLKLRADGSHKTLSVHLLPYKYIMMYTMLSKHEVRNAYEYCKNIGEILGYKDVDWLSCESINLQIISNIRGLGHKLRSLLSREEDSDHNDEDSAWLRNIDEVYCNFCEKYRLWNPRSMAPESFVSHLLNGSSDMDSVSDSGSQIKRDVLDNDYKQSLIHTELPNPQSNRQTNYDGGSSSAKTLDVYQKNVYDQHSQNIGQNFQAYGNPLLNKNIINQKEPVKYDVGNSSQNMGIYSQNINQYSQNVNPYSQNIGQHSQSIGQHSQNIGQHSQNIGQHSQNIGQHSQNISQHSHNISQHSQNIGQHSQNIGQHSQNISQYTRSQQVLPNQLPENKNVQRPVQSDKQIFTNSNFSKIKPPFEIPKEMTMTCPPRRTAVKNTSGSSVDRDHNDFHMGYEYSSSNQEDASNIINNNERSKNQDYLQSSMSSPQRLPMLPQKQTDFSFPTDNIQYTYSQNTAASDKPYQMQPTMFQPILNQDVRGSNETIDCFTNVNSYSRSRSQSNGSVGSGDSQMRSRQPISRSRNSSESKDPKYSATGHAPATRPLEPTKEENELSKQDLKQKTEITGSNEKKTGWNPLSWLTTNNKPREVNLPDDNKKQLEFDEVNKKWVDKSDPNSNKPPTPPPKMSLSSLYGEGMNSPATGSLYHGPTSPTFQKYRLPIPNVKDSSKVLSQPVPFMPSQMTNIPRQQSFEGESFSRDGMNQYNYNNHMDSYTRSPQPPFNQSYNANIYQQNYNGRGNE